MRVHIRNTRLSSGTLELNTISCTTHVYQHVVEYTDYRIDESDINTRLWNTRDSQTLVLKRTVFALKMPVPKSWRLISVFFFFPNFAVSSRVDYLLRYPGRSDAVRTRKIRIRLRLFGGTMTRVHTHAEVLPITSFGLWMFPVRHTHTCIRTKITRFDIAVYALYNIRRGRRHSRFRRCKLIFRVPL